MNKFKSPTRIGKSKFDLDYSSLSLSAKEKLLNESFKYKIKLDSQDVLEYSNDLIQNIISNSSMKCFVDSCILFEQSISQYDFLFERLKNAF